jgi:signal transduction histidine kinase
MTQPIEPAPTFPQRALEVLARTLRHEMGDLLQTIYSTVAILHDHLPSEQALERRLLTDLKGRAETCKVELDAVVDLVCPMSLNLAPTDLGPVVLAPVPAFTRRYSHISIRVDAPGPALVLADARRLGQLAPLLLHSACQSAQRQVEVRVGPSDSPAAVEWSIADDGFGATDEQLSWLTRPFTTTHHAQAGLSLALAQRIAHLHGGRFLAANRPAGGFEVRLLLPPADGAG